MGNSINPHIEHAQKSGTCNLSKLSITEFPPALLKVTTLRTLDISGKDFETHAFHQFIWFFLFSIPCKHFKVIG